MTHPPIPTHRFPRRQNRNGVATVEFAFVVAIAFAFFGTAFEFCRVAMIEHTVNNAVYEGIRVGILPGGTSAKVVETANRILSTIGISDARITVTPSKISNDTQNVTVRIDVPLDSNSFVPTNFFRNKSIDRSLTMRREGA